MSPVRFGFTSRKPRQTVPSTTSRCSPWLTPLVYFVGGRIVLPGYFSQVTVKGQEHIPRSGPVILAPTHRARWDSLVLPAVAGRIATGRDLHFMVTSDEVKGIQGWFIRRLGGFAVNVRSPSVSSLRHGIGLLQQGKMMVIYPEGGIFRDGQVHRLKPGLARLALQAESQSMLGVKILPVSIHYDTPYPRWRSQVEIRVGPALEVSSYLANRGSDYTITSECLKGKARRLTRDLADALIRVSQEEQMLSDELLTIGSFLNQDESRARTH
ncbi:MAG: lysophospholipid acyltransferase family protein [Cyanobacteria bacterium J06559_3]